MAFVRYDLSNTCGGEGYNLHNNENTSTPWQQQRLGKHSRGNGSRVRGTMKAVLVLGWCGAPYPYLIPCGRHPGLHFQCHPPLESWRRRWSHPPGRSGDGFPWRKRVIADPSKIVPIAIALTPVATNSSRASISA